MKNKNFWLVILAISLVFGMTVVGCEEEPDMGPLGGTVWTRSASSNTGSGNGFQTTFTLSFVDSGNATYNESGWTMFNNKKTTVNETSNYTYVYNTPSARKGALTPSKGTSGIGIIFEISANGKTLTTTSANTAVGLTGGTWTLKSGSVSGSSTGGSSTGGSSSGNTDTAATGSIKFVNNSGYDTYGGTISGTDYKAIPAITKGGNTTVTGLSVGTYTVQVSSRRGASLYYWKKTGVNVTKGGTTTVTVSSTGWGL